MNQTLRSLGDSQFNFSDVGFSNYQAQTPQNKTNKKIKNELKYLAEKVGGIEQLEFYPRNANPFINTRKGYQSVTLPPAGAYKIDQKELLSASLNFDNLKRES